MKSVVVYIHGKCGSIEEANHFKQFFDEKFKIIGFDYKSEKPWDAKIELRKFFNSLIAKYNEIYLIANSIGAYFSLISLSDMPIKKAMFISPIVDMEKIILNMMKSENITEDELKLKKEIETSFGESLSWQYLNYIRKISINWNIPTNILFADNDNMTSVDNMINFANNINANLTIMRNGEHWFHTEEQINFLDNWFKESFI
ncbi:alpha/beta hydrolase [Streptococcus zalophi]|uniref:alpha/beta hydrolase n=1 Tax=Streptococcus zalophi TaxID=640031 RepID=UPI00215C8AFF|nr:alpha/beta hydrolase [Streptococcus zalophi]MCR8967312.1 alpha/beta hydrolase [Streptococcus zalophi]